MGRLKKIKKIFYVSMMPETYSRSAVHFSYLQKSQSVECSFSRISPTGLKFYRDILQFRKYIKRQESPRTILVMSPSHKIVPFLQLLPETTLILDAGWSLSESSLERKKIQRRTVTIIKNYILDFLSFQLAELVILESENQIRYVRRKFVIKNSKMLQLWTGFDENQVSNDPNHFFEDKWKQLKERYKTSKIIVFRGKYNEESGLENLARATLLLAKENFLFIVITDQLPNRIVFSTNTILIQEFVDWDELKEILKICDFYVGQLSFNKRLANTVPHKAFEAGYFGLPYLTARNSGIEELYSDSQAIYLNGNIPQEFANRLRELKPTETERYRKAISIKYQENFSQRVLGKKLLLNLESFNRL